MRASPHSAGAAWRFGRPEPKACSRPLPRRQRSTGDDTFILSNEGLFGEGEALTPFIEALRKEADVKLVAYMRPAREWLPSAFAQWGIRHKTYPGPIMPFGEHAKYLIGQYEGIRAWYQSFSDILIVRLHNKTIDVVADFSEVIGIPLKAGQRDLERSEPAEMLLQALFNNRFEETVLPDRFSRTVIGSATIKSVDEMADLCFDYRGMDAVIAGRAELFNYVRDNIGIDLNATDPVAGPVDRDVLRDRILDYLIEINFLQAMRIQKLEADMAELRK